MAKTVKLSRDLETESVSIPKTQGIKARQEAWIAFEPELIDFQQKQLHGTYPWIQTQPA